MGISIKSYFIRIVAHLKNLRIKKPIDKIPKILNRNNISSAIENYKELLKNTPQKIESYNVFQMLTDLK